ncbi:MAG: hypothetical protein GXO75_15400 [Calditrichaeota bacterium]|nr:hypothetical protein [Calditrichota bacterium]
MSIVFQKSGLSDLTIEGGRLYPVSEPIRANQERYLTEDNSPKVVNYGDPLKLIKLVLDGLTRDNFDGTVNGLKTWFENSSINYSENNFTMVDETGQSRTVRLWQDDLDIKETSPGVFQVTLTLLEE